MITVCHIGVGCSQCNRIMGQCIDCRAYTLDNLPVPVCPGIFTKLQAILSNACCRRFHLSIDTTHCTLRYSTINKIPQIVMGMVLQCVFSTILCRSPTGTGFSHVTVKQVSHTDSEVGDRLRQASCCEQLVLIPSNSLIFHKVVIYFRLLAYTGIRIRLEMEDEFGTEPVHAERSILGH